MKKEIWKAVEGYEGYYEVSSYGRVRSLDRVEYDHFNRGECNCRKRLFKGRILKPNKVRNGYLQIGLSKSGKVKGVLIHRLVAEAFIPNPSNLPQVNHKDEVKTNNHVENLEWCTCLYNMRYGTCQQRRAEKQSIPVLQIDINTGEVITDYPSAREAERQLNIRQCAISECCNGKRKTAYGFKWKYQD